jgi:ParB family transcriptional regulator, chromosome partitioning protein
MIHKQDPKSKRSSLGKGITSLLGGFDADVLPVVKPTSSQPLTARQGAEVNDSIAHSKRFVVEIAQELIEVNPHQPRKIFKEEELTALAASIKVDGVIQPITIVKTESPGKYLLIAGERRLRASKLAGLSTIPAIIRDSMTDQEQLRVALIENIQRQDLNVLEEAEAYQSLIENFGLTQEQCAEQVGKERSTVANVLRILQLPKEVRADLAEGRLAMGHGRALLSIEDRKLILRARDIVIKKGLNVRQTEQLVKNYKGNQKSPGGKLGKDTADLEYLADSLRATLKTKIKISGNGGKGRIEISYFSSAELERLLAVFGHKMS